MIETKFKKTEVGMVPEDWKMTEIGEVLNVNTGSKNTQDKITDRVFINVSSG